MFLSKRRISVLVLTAVIASTMAAIAEEPTPNYAAFLSTPQWLGPKYLGGAEWENLEALVESLAASRERADDGQLQLYKLTTAVYDHLRSRRQDKDELYRDGLTEYRQKFPKSAFAPVVQAMHLNAMAWRARGNGYSSTVTDEGWALFKERNKEAWKVIQASKKDGARMPTWYEEAIDVGLDANIPSDELMEIFNEGIERFPGYEPIYYALIRQFAPVWGGSYEEADAFITTQVAAKTNVEGEELYTRLYWLIDDYEHGSPDFFEESMVDWDRMKTGFEQLMTDFPKSKVYPAAFASYACRAGDAATYHKVRTRVAPREFEEHAPEGISLDVCDARFITKT